MLDQPKPVYELAGQQADPITEEVLAVLFTDSPERASVRPWDPRRHQQWIARSPDGAASRGWQSFAQPLTTDVPALLEERNASALRRAFVPRHASSVTVRVIQTAVNELQLTWEIVRGTQSISTGAVLLPRGGE